MLVSARHSTFAQAPPSSNQGDLSQAKSLEVAIQQIMDVRSKEPSDCECPHVNQSVFVPALKSARLGLRSLILSCPLRRSVAAAAASARLGFRVAGR
jgi:hypothetical protein